MATLKHIASKNADYNAAYRYLVFEHDEKTGRQIFDEQGYAVVRGKYLIDGLLCTPDTFAMECRKLNKAFKKNQAERDIKTHHYIISYDPKGAEPGSDDRAGAGDGHGICPETLPRASDHRMYAPGREQSFWQYPYPYRNQQPAGTGHGEAPYKMRRCDTKAGYKHNSTREFLIFAQNGVVKMCLQHSLHQVDFGKSKKRITNQEYRVGRKGQERLDKKNQKLRAEGKPVRQTKFETEKEKIRKAIEAVLLVSKNEDDFKQLLEENYQITVKESRGRMLGDDYEKEAVLKAIATAKEKQKRQRMCMIMLPKERTSGVRSLYSLLRYRISERSAVW